MTQDTDTGSRQEQYGSIVETIRDGTIVFEPDGTIVFVNAAVEAYTGKSKASLVGSSLESLAKSGLFSAEETGRLRSALDELQGETAQEQQLRTETPEPDSRIFDVRLSTSKRDDEIVGIMRDVTERERALETLERQRDALQRLYQIRATGDLSDEGRIREVLELGCEYLDLPYGFLTTIEGQRQELVRVVGDNEFLQEGGTVDLRESYCKRTVESDGLVGIADVPAEMGPEDPAYSRFGLSCYVGTKVLVGDELYGTFCFAADDARDRSFDSTEREFVKLLGQWAGHAIERQQFERRLRRLNDVAGELLLTESPDAVAETAVETSASLFDLPVTACWKHEDDKLVPLAETQLCREMIGETPTFERGVGLIWESFDAGEIRIYEDISTESQTLNPDTVLRSEVHVPLGTHGVMIAGSTEPQAFNKIDVESLQLLGRIVEAAMSAVKRREAIVERGQALQRQNEQFEEFARVVAHDLRNPLSGAVGFLEIARETGSPAHFDRVEQSLDRMEGLIGELLDIARGERQPTDERDLPLKSIVDEAWSYVDAPEATLSVADDLGRLSADETRLLQLFGNLFRNAIEHVGRDVTVEVGRLSDGEGFYVENDGPSFPETKRMEVLQYGRTDSTTGTGIGLMSVADVTAAHDWTFDITNVEDGVRFEFETGDQ